MLWRVIKGTVRTAIALAIFACAVLFVWGMGATRFSSLDGRRSYYLGSPSSQAEIKEKITFADFGQIKGESVFLTEKVSVEEILSLYEAEVIFTERVGEVVSYYCFTGKWSDGVRIGEHFVNLHIAVRGEECSVGAPIIFGGF